MVGMSLVLLGAGSAKADSTWDSGGGADTAFETATNWDSAVPGSDDNYTIDDGGTAVFSAASGSITVKRGLVGEASGSSGTLNVSGGALDHSLSSGTLASRIGRGGTAVVNLSGGSLSYGHRLQVGGDGGTGTINLSGGELVVYRGGTSLGSVANTSFDLYQGALNISEGSLATRAGVVVGTNGVFSVQGSGATSIGIGSNGSLDGFWQQEAGGTLRVGIDLGGVTKIFVDDYEDDGGTSATLFPGALLDVDYYNGGFGGGTWTVLEAENATLMNFGLAFAPSVDTNVWSFAVDNSGTNGILTVTAIGDAAPTGGDSFTVEAEAYDDASGVRLEDNGDDDGGQNVAYISNNDWCLYENVLLGTNATLNFRAARPSGYDDGHIEVRLDSKDGTLIAKVDVPVTGGWQVYQTLSTSIAPVDGVHDIYLVFVETSTTSDASLFNLNWWSREVGPVRVEAEAYTAQSGVSFENTDDVGSGQSLSEISNGDWVEYTIDVETSGLYELELRVASDGGGGSINVVSDGVIVGTVSVEDTGGSDVWSTISTYVTFSETGSQTVRLEFVSGGFNFNWFDYQLAGDINTLTVGDTPNQMMRYGMDYERLWFWNSSRADDVADWSVNDCNIDYIRCAMNSAYELDEGTYDLSAYTKKIIPMMTVMQKANPNIKWFATPRPLNEAVSSATWQPYPIWVTGASSYTSGSYDFSAEKCAQYMIRYLLLMKSYGFKITYMDLTNEWQDNYASGGKISPDDVAEIQAAFDAYLANPWTYSGVDSNLYLEADDFPLMIGASSWNYSQGASWISKFTSDARRDAIDIASSHNTDKTGTAQDFADAAKTALGDEVEVWETEQHGWKGNSTSSEAMTFSYMIESVRAGFTGISGWLAIGTTSQGHCYLLSSGSTVTRNVKYYMFKKLSNTSNYGYALDIDQTDDLSSTMALIRENLLTVWIINTSSGSVLTEIDFDGHEWDGSEIKWTRWDEDLSIDGDETPEGIEGVVGEAETSSFMVELDGRATYCIEIPLVDYEDNFPFVQAESCATASGVASLACNDTDGGSMIEFSDAGDAISFELDITKTYTNDVAFRVSSESSNIQFDVYDGTNRVASIDRVATGGAQKWTTVYAPVPVDGGPMTLSVVATGGGWNMNWIEFNQEYYSTGSDVPNLAEGQTYDASNVYNDDATYDAGQAFDGDRGSRWATDTAPAWLKVDFGVATAINAFSMYEYGDRTTSFEIQYSNDGVNWYTAYTGGNPEDDTVYYFNTVTASQFRYQSIASSGSPTIYELEFYYESGFSDADPSAVMTLDGTSVSLEWSGVEGSSYSLQKSTNLMEGFTTLESGIPVHESTNVNVVATPDDSAFYRVLLED
jgi:hypothetical protein